MPDRCPVASPASLRAGAGRWARPSRVDRVDHVSQPGQLLYRGNHLQISVMWPPFSRMLPGSVAAAAEAAVTQHSPALLAGGEAARTHLTAHSSSGCIWSRTRLAYLFSQHCCRFLQECRDASFQNSEERAAFLDGIELSDPLR